MRRTLTITLIAIASGLALAACGEQQDQIGPGSAKPQNVSLMLDWFPNADHVGIYEALANGDLKQAGINLHVEVPSDPTEPLALVQAGKVDVAVSYEPEVMIGRDEKDTVLSFAALVQKPLTSIISIGSKHITTAAQLRGKTVGTAGIPYQSAYLSTILARAGVPASSVSQVNVGSDLVPAMLSGKVDATLGGYWNYEAIQLRQAHRRVNVIQVQQAGVPSYDELVLVCKEVYFENHVTLLRKLVQALGRGYAAVRADPQAGVDALVRANPSLNERLQLASVKATLPAFFPTDGRPWGWQYSTLWDAFGQWMFDHHLIAHLAARYDASTDQLLAGQGP